MKNYMRLISMLLSVTMLLLFCTQCNKPDAYSVSSVESSDSQSENDNNPEKEVEPVEQFTVYPPYETEYEDTYAKVKALTETGSFTYIMLTDTHIDYVKKLAEGEDWYLGKPGDYYVERHLIEREVNHVIELANTTDVDCVILGGDLIHGTYSYESSIADLKYFAKVFTERCNVPVYVNRGNHDTNDYHRLVDGKCYVNNIITQSEWVDILVDPLSNKTAVHADHDEKSTYYYADFEDKKTRLIVLDSYNYPIYSDNEGFSVWRAETWTGIEAEQIHWLINEALDTSKQGWTFLISSHAPIVGTETAKGSDKIRKIIKAFNNRECVTVDGITVDYTKVTDISIPLSISGHTHVGSTRLFKEADHIAVNTGSGKISYYPNNNYTDTDTQVNFHDMRYEGTATEAKVDIVSYSTDGTVTKISFGSGIDEIYQKEDYCN